MDNKKDEFLKRLRATFRIEAEEHVRAISAGLMELEKTPALERRAQVIETIFREAHSLKGAARSVSLIDIESICQPMESIFAALKRQDISLAPVLYDLLHQATDMITQLIAETGEESAPALRSRSRELIRQLKDISTGTAQFGKHEEPVLATAAIASRGAESQTAGGIKAVPNLTVEKPVVMAETVRIPTARLDPLLLQAEEMISVKIAASQRAVELQEINNALVSWKAESDTWKARQSPGLEWDELLAWNKGRLNALQSQVAAVIMGAEQDQRAIRHLVDEHLEAMKSVLMFPVSLLVEVLPKFARDLARAQGKEVELLIQGAEIEIDKRILEELKDPLIHLVRNCIDHGIAKPEERTREGKQPCGTIRITFVAKDNRWMEVSVSDDGPGVALDKVRAAAVKMGLLPADAAKHPGAQETVQLIFVSGMSTSPIITDISGRGLGLAIVREKVEKLGGTVFVESQPRAGTTFRLLLPMTLATFRGVLVRAGEFVFVVPASNVERVLRVRKEDIKTIENRETIRLDGHILPMARLRDTLELPVRKNGSAGSKTPGFTEANHMPVIVLTSSEKSFAFLVDEVLQEQEVLVKGLGAQLKRVRNIAGATILGTGKVVLVLNVQDLMKSAVRSAAVTRKETVTGSAPVKTGRILVAEDSITSRSLLKNILETAGYQVATAVDGTDAFTQLRGNEFDLVVSDVDMPRMNGFELTAKIRGNKKLSDVPIVLVTALESREDRERGIEVGANAYIIKSSFDQSNLLDVIHKLL
ncbi:MAG: response regulator [Bacteroidota bacterium]|jgi:two-component system chemotaxis sensor kinase CheA